MSNRAGRTGRTREQQVEQQREASARAVLTGITGESHDDVAQALAEFYAGKREKYAREVERISGLLAKEQREDHTRGYRDQLTHAVRRLDEASEREARHWHAFHGRAPYTYITMADEQRAAQLTEAQS